MIIVQHLSYDQMDEGGGPRRLGYALFTALVGLALLARWQGYLPALFGVDTALLIALFGGYKIYFKAIAGLFERRITADLAIMLAIGAALAIGEYVAAAEAVLIMLIGEGLEAFASRRTRRAIERLIDLAPRRARVRIEGEGEREVAVAEVKTGDIVIVRPGERIPVDGTIRFGCSAINEAPITGESLPVEKGFGEAVYAGSVNTIGALEIEATGVGEETTLARIVALIENAERQKAPAVRLADRYASWFLPLLAVAAGATFYFTGDGMRTVAVLLVACPCALILATPAAVVAGIGRLARAGVLVRSGAQLEAMAGVDCVAFDKTGTLTAGRPAITRIATFNGRSENEVLTLAALAEQLLANIEAFVAGERPPAEAGFRIVGAHTDSPNLRVKQKVSGGNETQSLACASASGRAAMSRTTSGSSMRPRRCIARPSRCATAWSLRRSPTTPERASTSPRPCADSTASPKPRRSCSEPWRRRPGPRPGLSSSAP